MIRDIGEMYDIKGFNHSPLEREKVVEFLSRLGDIQRRQQREFEKLQVTDLRVLRVRSSDLHKRVILKHRTTSTTPKCELWILNSKGTRHRSRDFVTRLLVPA